MRQLTKTSKGDCKHFEIQAALKTDSIKEIL